MKKMLANTKFVNTNDDGKPFFEYDVLILSNIDFSGLLVKFVITPSWVQGGKLCGNSIKRN